MTEAELKALSDAATQGEPVAWLYDEREGDGQIIQLNRANMDQRYWRETPLCRAGTIGDTAAAEKAGYERGLREAAEVAKAEMYSDDEWGQHTRWNYVCDWVADAILAKLEKTDD